VTSDVSRLRALYMGTFRDANDVMAKNDLRSCGSRTRCSQFPCGPSGIAHNQLRTALPDFRELGRLDRVGSVRRRT
jgi:hypothetical protein